jgi:hypothetical protein
VSCNEETLTQDLDVHTQRGLIADGYDLKPTFGWAEVPKGSYDLVTAVYVVNVLSTLEDRLAAARSASAKVRPGGYLLLVARSESAIAKEAERGQWERVNDGWISNPAKGTFQKGIPHTELAWLLGAAGMPICACRLKCSSDVAWILGRKDAAGGRQGSAVTQSALRRFTVGRQLPPSSLRLYALPSLPQISPPTVDV